MDQPPLLRQTIPAHFASIVSEHGDRPAVIWRTPTPAGGGTAAAETTYTYAALDARSNALAHGLRSLGVRPGDRVAVSLGNCGEFAALTYAVLKLGAVLVPLNPGFGGPQLAAALALLSVEVLVAGAVADVAYKPGQGRSNLRLLRGLVADLHARRVEAPAVPTLRRVVVVDNTVAHAAVGAAWPAGFAALTPFNELAAGSTAAVVPDGRRLDAHDTANIQFTSGTTSQPKAAMLSHASVLNNGHLVAHRMRLAAGDRVVCPPALFHCFGSVLGYMAAATAGAAVLFPSPAFDPAASLDMAAAHAATGLHGVATMFIAMLELLEQDGRAGGARWGGHDFAAHLRTGIAAGSSVPEALMRRLAARLGLPELVICYGMTETSPVSCMTAPDDAPARRAATVGRPLPHTAVKIVDRADRARVVPRGVCGELAAAGYLVMQGYWADEPRTRDALRPDAAGAVWMHSGDEACMDRHGYVRITGRIKDLIIRAGENIHPLEIENCLLQHPLVSDASVVGVPDRRLGEAVAAFVVAQQGVAVSGGRPAAALAGSGDAASETVLAADDVRAWVGARLSAHLVPKFVFWIDDYPKTASGKIQKFRLREMARELAGDG